MENVNFAVNILPLETLENANLSLFGDITHAITGLSKSVMEIFF